MLQNVKEPELEFQDYKSIDEDIDLMNDETFGQTSLETNWEEEHERYTASTLVTTQNVNVGTTRPGKVTTAHGTVDTVSHWCRDLHEITCAWTPKPLIVGPGGDMLPEFKKVLTLEELEEKLHNSPAPYMNVPHSMKAKEEHFVPICGFNRHSPLESDNRNSATNRNKFDRSYRKWDDAEKFRYCNDPARRLNSANVTNHTVSERCERTYYDCNEKEDHFQEATRDEYAGIMTQREKDWIIKIQLMQLQTDNPYLDDYYFTTWNLKKSAKAMQARFDAGLISDEEHKHAQLTLILPSLSRNDSRSYQPVQFENSLGRLTSCSVHNPRRIISIAKDTTIIDADQAKSRFRRTLSFIEHAYDLLLEIDELEKRVLGLPEDRRIDLMKKRTQIVLALYARLMEESQLMQMVSVSKGADLVCRIFPLLDHDRRVVITNSLLYYPLPTNRDDQALSSLGLCNTITTVLKAMSFYELCQLATELNIHILDEWFESEIWCHLPWCMLIRAETIFTITSTIDIEPEQLQRWSHFVLNLTERLLLCTTERVATLALSVKSTVLLHFRRYVDTKTFQMISDKLPTCNTTTY